MHITDQESASSTELVLCPWERAQNLSLHVGIQTLAFSILQSNQAIGFRQTLAPTKTRLYIQGLKFHLPGKDCPKPAVILHRPLFQGTNLKCFNRTIGFSKTMSEFRCLHVFKVILGVSKCNLFSTNLPAVIAVVVQ